jgi:hypothetical protein
MSSVNVSTEMIIKRPVDEVQKFVMRTTDGPFPMETTYLWKSLSGSETVMTLINRGSPSGFSKFLVPFMSFAMRKANLKDLLRIKQILEI